LIRAQRIIDLKDIYQPVAHILKSLTRDQNKRPRDLRPGEIAETLWDEIQGSKWRMAFGEVNDKEGIRGFDNPESGKLPNRWAYGEADALEDSILFPDDAESSLPGEPSSLDRWEHHGPSIKRLVYDLDSDEDSDIEDKGEEVGDDSEEESDGELQRINPFATPAEVWSVVPTKPLEQKSWDTGFTHILGSLMRYVEEPERVPGFLQRDQTFKWLQKWDNRNMELYLRRLKQEQEATNAECMEFVQRDKSHGKQIGYNGKKSLIILSI
jgi:hypothetical protein